MVEKAGNAGRTGSPVRPSAWPALPSPYFSRRRTGFKANDRDHSGVAKADPRYSSFWVCRHSKTRAAVCEGTISSVGCCRGRPNNEWTIEGMDRMGSRAVHQKAQAEGQGPPKPTSKSPDRSIAESSVSSCRTASNLAARKSCKSRLGGWMDAGERSIDRAPSRRPHNGRKKNMTRNLPCKTRKYDHGREVKFVFLGLIVGGMVGNFHSGSRPQKRVDGAQSG